MYDRSTKMYDEPHSPKDLESRMAEGALHKDKFLSFAHHDSYFRQMLTMRNLNVASILEIGPGENFVADYFRSRGVQYDTLDIVEQSNPTILGELESLDLSEYTNKYNLVCAFQMLEHSPYLNFVTNLDKMSRMSDDYVFISLPYSCFGFRLSFNFSFGQNKNRKRDLSFYWPLNKDNRRYREEFKEEFPWAVHYWEIGRKGYPLRRIKADIESVGLRITDTFHSNNPFHFFILARK